ncbi:MAG: DUF512 domain-containing protein [Candidatus Cloacimonadota bacterium]|nr:DUF512 domain-containing protein [Candidatus Cloacimonadota bacterium]
MSLKIRSVEKTSELYEAGIRSGDFLLEINEHEISDIIDYKFHQADEKLELVFRKNDELLAFFMEKEYYQDLGLTFYPIKYRNCVCNCVFCFVDQMHPDSRKSLKVKDDDFRLSFLHGNFITLTNMQEADFTRIVEQQLSPLYISVHSTDDTVRKKMMRYRKNVSILDKLKFFGENKIKMHTQIVLVPEWNDGKFLEKTVFDLTSLFPAVQSVAIVPVGLTKFRKELTPLKKLSKNQAKEIIGKTDQWRKDCEKKYGKGIITLADEFFLIAEQQVPSAQYYDDFPQLENGIGMTRQLLDNWEYFADEVKIPENVNTITICTAKLIYPVMKKLATIFAKTRDLSINVLPVENDYLGKNVTVSGLLSAGDVIGAIKKNQCGDLIFLPKNMFNDDGITLDGITLEMIERETGKSIRIFP